jgi:ribose 5-phosphate isomerase B
MKIAIANDHRGIELKQRLLNYLEQHGHEASNMGTDTADSVDYPDYAAKVCEQVATGEVERGILICGSGIGMNIAANKHKNIRSVRAQDEYDAEWCRRHNNANVLCLSADRIGKGSVDRIIEIFLTTEFEGGRHERRVRKLGEIENRSC